MKHWRINLLLFISICVIFTTSVTAQENDDGVTVEEEQIVSLSTEKFI